MDLYHVINHGVEGRDLFSDTGDYARFVHDLYEFNDTAPAPAYERRVPNTPYVGRPTSYIRSKLVEIHGWVLMKNHYHLLLSELTEGGLSLFLKKLNGGYAKYFNERYERRGTLFRGKTKKVLVKEHAHFLYVLHYVHLNPLDYLPGAKGWRERDKGGVNDVGKALSYLKNYRWSSYLDYCGIKNFPSLISTSLFKSGSHSFEGNLKEYLSDRAADTNGHSASYELEY